MPNLTLNVPDGTAVYGNQICTPASWTDILTFYLSNYLVHVGSVQFHPGERTKQRIAALISALLFPTSGLARGLDRIVGMGVNGTDVLAQARRSGALCMVIRSRDWQPIEDDDSTYQQTQITRDETRAGARVGKVASMHEMTDIVNNATASAVRPPNRDEESVAHTKEVSPSSEHAIVAGSTAYFAAWQYDRTALWDYMGSGPSADIFEERSVYGTCELPVGYSLSIVPRDSIVEHLHSPHAMDQESTSIFATYKSRISNLFPSTATSSSDDPLLQTIIASQDLLTGLSGVIQLLFGLATLYDTSGPQIQRFGYAAFGLTVLPYTVMSLINVLATLVTPSYPYVYLVDTEIMQEAIGRGGVFSGLVGKIRPDPDLETPSERQYLAPNGTVYVPSHPGFQRRCKTFPRMPLSRMIRRPSSMALTAPIAFLSRMCLGCVPLLIIGVMTRFQAGQSSYAEQVITMLWLAMGVVLGLAITDAAFNLQNVLSVAVVYGAPAIAGFVEVGIMLTQFGSCIQIAG